MATTQVLIWTIEFQIVLGQEENLAWCILWREEGSFFCNFLPAWKFCKIRNDLLHGIWWKCIKEHYCFAEWQQQENFHSIFFENEALNCKGESNPRERKEDFNLQKLGVGLGEHVSLRICFSSIFISTPTSPVRDLIEFFPFCLLSTGHSFVPPSFFFGKVFSP